MHTMKLDYDYPDQTDQHMVPVEPEVDITFDQHYSYYKNSLPYRIGRRMLHIVGVAVGYVVCKMLHGIRYEGRHHLRAHRKALRDGCITICNHVFRYDYICIMIGLRPHMPFFPTWNIKLRDKDRHLVNLTGGIPLPDNLAGWKAFFQAMDQHMAEKAWMHFFPEAAMWPYYQTIRPFKDGAFALAVKHDRPVLPMAFRFRNPGQLARMLGIREPLATLHIGEPIYPDPTIERKRDRIRQLHERCRQAVCQLAGHSVNE